MKQLFYFMAILSLGLLACEKDDPILNEKKTYQHPVLNITDAKMLVVFEGDENPSGRVPGNQGGDNLYKLTDSGEFEKVNYVNPDGTNIDPDLVETKMEVHYVESLDDELLFMHGRFTFYDTIGFPLHYWQILVRKSDGAIFDFASIAPSRFHSDRFINSKPFVKDDEGLFYCAANLLDANGMPINGSTQGPTALLRLDVSNVEHPSYINILPTGQVVQKFVVDKAGNIFYQNVSQEGGNDFKIIKRAGGLIIPDEAFLFPWIGINGSFYSVKGEAIYKLEIQQDDLIEHKVWEWMPSEELSYMPSGIGEGFRINRQQTTIGIGSNRIWEFNEATQTVKFTSLPEDLIPLNYEKLVQTDEYVYMYNGSSLYKMNISNYQYTEVTNGKYEFYTFGTGPNNELMFSALRYSDGKKVLGKITSDDNILFINEEGEKDIVYLIRID